MFDRGDIVRVPFPYVDDNRRRVRPGVVVSSRSLGGELGLLWVVMVTSAENPAWPDDIEIGERYREFGLPIPSRIRVAKIAAISVAQASFVGRVDPKILREIVEKVTTIPRIDGAVI